MPGTDTGTNTDTPVPAMTEYAGKPQKLLCLGFGAAARTLAEGLKGAGWEVAGTCRDMAEAEGQHALKNVPVHEFNRYRPLAGDVFAGVTHMLSSVPPDEDGDPVLDMHGKELAAMPELQWVGYLSTTGVYGDRGGVSVDEESPLNPSGERGRRRAVAEDGWRALWQASGVPVHIFRLAGIYGPGRSALDMVRSGRAKKVIKPGQVFSRIHIADLVRVLRASMDRPRPDTVYNVCDDEPAPPQDVTDYACSLLGVEPPPPVSLEEAELSEMARSFYDDNKRVSNTLIKKELNVTLEFPDYRKGLDAIFRNGG